MTGQKRQEGYRNKLWHAIESFLFFEKTLESSIEGKIGLSI